MTSSFVMRTSTLFVAFLTIFALSFSAAFAHNGVVHDTPSSSAEITKMQQMVTLLTQLVELYKKQAALKGVILTVADHHVDTSKASEELEVWVELHSNQTHAHMKQPGKTEESWLLADIAYTDEDAVIEAIAEKSGLSIHDIEEVIVFPSGEVDEHGDSVEGHDEDAEHDVAGIHIMSDGTVMWGNGDEVEGATITSDNKVKLADGSIVTPKFDLR